MRRGFSQLSLVKVREMRERERERERASEQKQEQKQSFPKCEAEAHSHYQGGSHGKKQVQVYTISSVHYQELSPLVVHNKKSQFPLWVSIQISLTWPINLVGAGIGEISPSNRDCQFHPYQRWPYRLVEFPLAHQDYGLAHSPAGWHQSWDPSGQVDVLTRSQSHQRVSRYQLRSPLPL